MMLHKPLFPFRAEFCFFNVDAVSGGVDPEQDEANRKKMAGEEMAHQKYEKVDLSFIPTGSGSTAIEAPEPLTREDTTPKYAPTGKTAAERRTERLARAAQRINNKVYLGGGNYSQGSSYGPNGTFTPGQYHKPEDISKPGGIVTEDLLQQNLNRGLLSEKRKYNELEVVKEVNQFARDIDKLRVQGNIAQIQSYVEGKIRKALASHDNVLLKSYIGYVKQLGLNVDQAFLSEAIKHAEDMDYQMANRFYADTAGQTGMRGIYNPRGDQIMQKTAKTEQDIQAGIQGLTPSIIPDSTKPAGGPAQK